MYMKENRMNVYIFKFQLVEGFFLKQEKMENS